MGRTFSCAKYTRSWRVPTGNTRWNHHGSTCPCTTAKAISFARPVGTNDRPWWATPGWSTIRYISGVRTTFYHWRPHGWSGCNPHCKNLDAQDSWEVWHLLRRFDKAVACYSCVSSTRRAFPICHDNPDFCPPSRTTRITTCKCFPHHEFVYPWTCSLTLGYFARTAMVTTFNVCL